MGKLAAALADWTKNGSAVIGEVRIVATSSGGYRIHHTLDNPDTDPLEIHHHPLAARAIAADDADGNYRPLKSAPTLRRGWLIHLASLDDTLAALAFLYPGALGLAVAYQNGDIEATPLRETLDRQTGMYRIAAKIEDTDAEEVVAATCNPSNCLKVILWELRRHHGKPKRLPTAKIEPNPLDDRWQCPRIPLVCREACTFVISNARKVVKQGRPSPNPAAPH